MCPHVGLVMPRFNASAAGLARAPAAAPHADAGGRRGGGLSARRCPLWLRRLRRLPPDDAARVQVPAGQRCAVHLPDVVKGECARKPHIIMRWNMQRSTGEALGQWPAQPSN